MKTKLEDAKTRLSVELMKRLKERAKSNYRSKAAEMRAILTTALESK